MQGVGGEDVLSYFELPATLQIRWIRKAL